MTKSRPYVQICLQIEVASVIKIIVMLGFIEVFFLYSFVSESVVTLLSRTWMESSRDDHYKYILVLGNKGGLDSLVTQDRAKKAALAAKKYPEAKLLLTGNEKEYQEVTHFKKLLSQHGLSDFIEEKESTTTWQNMVNSLKLMGEHPKVLVITSKYHHRRSLAMARSLGMKANAFGNDLIKYKHSLFYFIKERFSNMLYCPRILFNYIKRRFF